MERVPCDPENKETDKCDVYRSLGRCYMDKHHLFYPKTAYPRTMERKFRNLAENQIEICRNMHNIEHAVFSPPDKPSLEIMSMAVEEERNRRLNGLS